MTVDRIIFGRPLRSVAFDAAVSGLVALVAVLGIFAQPGGVAGAAVGIVMALVLLFRRTHPSAVAAGVAVLALLQVVVGWGPLAYDIGVLIALYSVVKYADRLRDGVLAGIVAAIGVLLAAAQMPAQAPWWAGALYYGLVTGAVWLVGLNVRTRRLYVVSLEERATTLEREREAEARAAVAEERTRIARELHDVVAHSMAVMIVQADGVRFTIDRDPDTAREAAKVVADTGRQALEEMRRLVGVLREPSRPEPADAPAAAAEPGGGLSAEPAHRRPALVELPDLLDRFRAAGLRITDTTTGTPIALPPGLELTVYRVVQESLTNALKHAGVGAAVELRLDWSADAVAVRAVDDGRGRPVVRPAPSGGHGLVGMRERVGVYDGSLTAGPALGGGWRVEARLPLPSASGTEEGKAAA
ncbi:two-component sensor histidine kinase [Micromonospora terminaliae]|uniref:histidine kinase n=1 Tax=Micromonospora terminaliae TaxID=1914461 RepID=A0AAJ2ZBX9_9ACTN|nr:histidine kinase [Micromonospora terminaliae]NES27387.1 two-component sensor histidine kinase [Micromonospora terminaliae]QGL47870.1 two-component sensor histidine kinase [Micromonospora terminaliae]